MNRFTLEVAGDSCAQSCSHCPHGKKISNDPELIGRKVEYINKLTSLFYSSNQVNIVLMDSPFESKISLEEIDHNTVNTLTMFLGTNPESVTAEVRADTIKNISNIYSSLNTNTLERVPRLSFSIGVHDLEDMKNGMQTYASFLSEFFSALDVFSKNKEIPTGIHLALSVNDWKGSPKKLLDSFHAWMEKNEQPKDLVEIMEKNDFDYLSQKHLFTDSLEGTYLGRKKSKGEYTKDFISSQYRLLNQKEILAAIQFRVINRRLSYQQESIKSQVGNVLDMFRRGDIALAIQPDGDFHLGHSTTNIMNQALKIPLEKMDELLETRDAGYLLSYLETHLENKLLDLEKKEHSSDQ